MTDAVAAAVEVYLENNQLRSDPEETNLNAPKLGNPISHGQLLAISKYLKSHPEKIEGKEVGGKQLPIHLSDLLKGCGIYTPPPKPKPEPVRLPNLLDKHSADITFSPQNTKPLWPA
jgi:hypothetical protein